MRNLILFLIRYNAFFVFLLLEGVALFFVIRNHNYHRAGFLNSAGLVTGNIYNTYFSFGEYLNLNTVNEQLMEENAWLRERQNYMLIPDSLNTEVLKDSLKIFYEFIPVKVINYTTDKVSNYITLNKGKNHGIDKDMGVITGNGVVGIVSRVSNNFSTVMSVLHKNTRVSIKIKKFNYPGTLQWSGGSPALAELTGIPQHLPIAEGDTVVTSGFSAIFPENIPVGVIQKFQSPPGSSFYEVTIKLLADFETLQYAYVINNTLQDEQRELEKTE